MSRSTKLALLALPVALGLFVGCSSDSPTAPNDLVDAGTDAPNTIQAPGFTFVTPMDGEIAAPGDSLELRVISDARIAPALLVNEASANLTWIVDAKDATLWSARFTVPADPSGTITLAAVGPTSDYSGDTKRIALAQPKEVVKATLGAGETTLTITSTGAVLHVPANAVTGGGEVSFASYDQSSVPDLAGAKLLAPIYRVHLSADETAVNAAFSIDQPISPAAVNAFGANSFPELAVYEGPDPDDEAAPPRVRANLEVKVDGSGVIHAALPSNSFHHTGSCATIVSLQDTALPFGVTAATVEASNDQDSSSDMQSLLVGLNAPTPTVQLSNAGNAGQAHVTLNTTVEWKDESGNPSAPPANLSPPLSTLGIVSPLGTLRWSDTGQKWRVHEGVDFRAQDPTDIFAVAKGKLWLNMNAMNSINLVVSPQWEFRYLHISIVNGTTSYNQSFKKSATFGKTVGGTVAKAPSDGTYGLDCFEKKTLAPITNKVIKSELQCSVINTDTSTSLANKGCSSASKAFCIKQSQNIWVRDVAAGELIGKTGQTKAPGQPHLHFENFYTAPGLSEHYPVDSALFWPASLIYDTTAGLVPAGRTEMIRLGAMLDGPSNLLGVDQTTFESLIDLSKTPLTSTAICPYDNTMALDPMTNFSLVRVTGDNSGAPPPQTITWDLGPCIWSRVHNNNPVDVTVGPTFWRRAKKDQGTPADKLTGWLYVDDYLSPPPAPITQGIRKGSTSDYSLTGTITMCNGLANPANCPSAAPISVKTFEGMQVTVQGLNGEFATSTMTLGKVTSVPSIASYQTSHPNEAGGLSGTVPMNAQLFTFLDNAQPAGVLGFPSTFVPNNFANRNGRSNFIAVWQDVNKKWQWVMNVSGGSYNTNGGFPQWHEYQFIYDSRPTANPHNRYDVYLGQNATGTNFTFNRTAKTQVTVTPIAAQLKPFQP